MKNKDFEKSQLHNVNCCATCKHCFEQNWFEETNYFCKNEERGMIINIFNQEVSPYQICGFYEE